MTSTLSLPPSRKTATLASTKSSKARTQQSNVSAGQNSLFGIVQVFINASIACICFERGLLPQKSPAFIDRFVDDLGDQKSRRLLTYNDFLQIKQSGGGKQAFKILTKGQDKKADAILNLLVCFCVSQTS